MSFGTAKKNAPSGLGCTGTTGIILTDKDRILWDDRVFKENRVNGKMNPDGFTMRSAVRVLGNPVAPHRWKPEDGGGLSFEDLGWDPQGKDAKDLQWCMHRKGSVPRDRKAFPETASHGPGFLLQKPTAPPGVARSASLPGKIHTETWYSENLDRLRAIADKRHERRLRRFDDTEAQLEAKLAESGLYLNKGARGSKYCRPRYETDATAFENHFILHNCGIALHQTRPSDKVVLKQRNGQLASPWCP